MRPLVLGTVLLFAAFFAVAEDFAERISSLIDPAKLATLGARGANPRVQKATYWLSEAQKAKADPKKVATNAVALAGYTNSLAAQLTIAALLRNLDIAEQLRCLDADGMAEMRKGKSPTVKRGPYRGQELSVDHIILGSVVPELDCVIANLELLPLRLNESKNAKIGSRQRALAGQLFRAGLLSDKGLVATLQRPPIMKLSGHPARRTGEK